MIKGISGREFSRRDGSSEMLVRRAIKEGKLVTLEGGKLDPALVGSGWRPGNRNNEPAATTLPEETVEAAAERLLKSSPLLTVAEAERMKENYLALSRKLEYEERSGKLVQIEHVAVALGRSLAVVRSVLLAIPAELAPKLHRLKTVGEVQDTLQKRITRALQELSRGEPGDDE